MKTKLVEPSEACKKLHTDLANFLKKFCDDHGTTSEELLAILAYMVGQTIALQDQREWTGDKAMSFVAANIQKGNQDVIDSLHNVPPSGEA